MEPHHIFLHMVDGCFDGKDSSTLPEVCSRGAGPELGEQCFSPDTCETELLDMKGDQIRVI